MLDSFLKFVELVKDLSLKKILSLSFMIIIIISVAKIEHIIPVIEKVFPKPIDQKINSNPKRPVSLLITEKDVDISKENQDKIKSYVETYISPIANKTILVGIFKYMPEGAEYQYQGGILVYAKIPINQPQDLLKELNLGWVPLWSGRFVNSALFDKFPTKAKYDDVSQMFKLVAPEEYKDNVHKLPSVNVPILTELGVKDVFYYPVIKGTRTVGYIAYYLSDLDPSFEASLVTISKNLASRISLYLIED